jgi:hypothetical protein
MKLNSEDSDTGMALRLVWRVEEETGLLWTPKRSIFYRESSVHGLMSLEDVSDAIEIEVKLKDPIRRLRTYARGRDDGADELTRRKCGYCPVRC